MNVVITGASKGIGRAIALKFATNGHHLAICARGAEALNALAEEIRQVNPQIQLLVTVADMSKTEEVKFFGQQCNEFFGHIDILINNAGVFIPGALTEEPDGNLELMIHTNLYSAYHLTRRIVPGMISRKSGSVFNICSIASVMAYANGGSYSISKFALLGFSKCLREELKPHGIRVCAVLPGATLTDSWAGVEIPEDRFMPAEDVAEIIYATAMLSNRTVVEDIILRPQLGDL